MRVVTHHPSNGDTVARLRIPRDDVVVEVVEGPDRFGAATGPFDRYERRLEVGPDDVVQTIDCALAIPFWWIIFWLPVRSALRRGPGRSPWWTPPAVLDRRAATVLGLLASLAVVDGYVSTLLTQTITFAADELGATRTDQGIALASVRVGVVLAIVLASRADRVGRRRMLVGAASAACVTAAAGALAPSLAWLSATQLLTTGCAGAAGILIAITAAEEMPAGSRAYAYSLITMAGGLGAGMCLWVLPAADLDVRAWRIVYLVPLLGIPVVAAVARRLPESQRFTRAPRSGAATRARGDRAANRNRAPSGSPGMIEPSPASAASATPQTASADSLGLAGARGDGLPARLLRGHGRRLALLAGAAFLAALFVAPAFQLQNDFLREQQGFSAARISLFTVVTSTPASLGIVLGGRLADVRGRRVIGAIGLIGGTLGVVASFASTGWPLWAWAMGAAIVGGMTVPALGVYRPELFPTGLRGRASASIEAIALTGSAIGLVTVGRLVDRWDDYAVPMAIVAAGPLAAAVLVLFAFPETARRELEDLNPEDAPPPARPAVPNSTQ
ncbi:MAG: MFS transporter [Acidimicrobiales bacterium]